jgi:hypothetical protein
MGIGNTPVNRMYKSAYNRAKEQSNNRIKKLQRFNALVRQVMLAAMKNRNNKLVYKKPVK